MGAHNNKNKVAVQVLWQTQRCSSLFLQKTVFLQRRSLFGKGLNRSEREKGGRKQEMKEQDSVRSIKGIGEKTEKLLAKLGIFTVGDFLRYYPRDYDAVSYTHLTLPTIRLV